MLITIRVLVISIATVLWLAKMSSVFSILPWIHPCDDIIPHPCLGNSVVTAVSMSLATHHELANKILKKYFFDMQNVTATFIIILLVFIYCDEVTCLYFRAFNIYYMYFSIYLYTSNLLTFGLDLFVAFFQRCFLYLYIILFKARKGKYSLVLSIARRWSIKLRPDKTESVIWYLLMYLFFLYLWHIFFIFYSTLQRDY